MKYLMLISCLFLISCNQSTIKLQEPRKVACYKNGQLIFKTVKYYEFHLTFTNVNSSKMQINADKCIVEKVVL